MWGAKAQLSAVQQGAITTYTPQLSKGQASNSAGRNTNVVKLRLHMGQAGTVQLLQQDRLLHMQAMDRKQCHTGIVATHSARSSDTSSKHRSCLLDAKSCELRADESPFVRQQLTPC